jgi:predicted DNA-binding transcriptional regulator AlpA
MRTFGYITVGQILDTINQEMFEKTKKRLSRPTFYKLEKQNLFPSKRTIGKWRVYTEDEAKIVIQVIRENYRLADPDDPISIDSVIDVASDKKDITQEPV